MAKTFPNLAKTVNLDALTEPHTRNMKQTAPKSFIIKLLKATNNFFFNLKQPEGEKKDSV